mgnify:CR=1 FL=1
MIILLIVQKYGGSSVATTDLILNIAKRVKKQVEAGNKLVVVVSAQGKTTDNLLYLAKSINTNPSKREIDMLISTGEQQSSALLAITLEKIGVEYEIVDYVEIDKYAVASFNAIHDTNYQPQDICTWNKDIQVDLIMHGSPCQDFSLAGRQAGGDKDSGTRSSLMYETIRIVEKLKPKYVIWENVKNLISKKHIHNFNAYIETLNELGYKSYYKV